VEVNARGALCRVSSQCSKERCQQQLAMRASRIHDLLHMAEQELDLYFKELMACKHAGLSPEEVDIRFALLALEFGGD